MIVLTFASPSTRRRVKRSLWYFDVTLGMRGAPAKSPSAQRTAKWERACMAPGLVHSSVLQSHWAIAPLWVCISTAGVVKFCMMNPARFLRLENDT